jgi:hypothetical protein
MIFACSLSTATAAPKLPTLLLAPATNTKLISSQYTTGCLAWKLPSPVWSSMTKTAAAAADTPMQMFCML